MRIGGSVREMAKWGAVGVIALTLAGYAWDRWGKDVEYSDGASLTLGIEDGCFLVRTENGVNKQPARPRGFYFYDYPIKRHWVRWGPMSRSNTAYDETFVPFWVPAFVMTSALLLIWRIRREKPTSIGAKSCGKCGFDRVGLEHGGKCPECGTTPM